MELLQAPQHLVNHLLLRENRGSESENGLYTHNSSRQEELPEVVGARLLAEAGAWDDADAGCFQEAGGVEDVSWLAGFLGRLHGGNQLREG